MRIPFELQSRRIPPPQQFSLPNLVRLTFTLELAIDLFDNLFAAADVQHSLALQRKASQLVRLVGMSAGYLVLWFEARGEEAEEYE